MTTRWRPLTDEEALRWPMARLGGSLAVVTMCAGVLSVAAVGGMVVILHQFGVFGLGIWLMAMAGGDLELSTQLGLIYSAPVAVLLFSGVVLLTMTLVRTPATPVVASTLAALYYVMAIAAAVLGQIVLFSRNGQSILEASPMLVSFLPHWIGGLMMLAGFCGYMVGGVRPNAYFRRRVAVGREDPAPADAIHPLRTTP